MTSSGPRPAARVAILGGGRIGAGLVAAMLGAGGRVELVEPDPDVRAGLRNTVAAQFAELRLAGHACGDTTGMLSRLAVAAGLDGIPDRPDLVVEAAPEAAAVKRSLFATLCARFTAGVPLATTSSAIPVAELVPDRAAEAWCLNAHCFNPPAILRAVELVPAAGTLPAAMERAGSVLVAVGFEPVPLGHAVPAFVGNRLQAAVLREAYRLVDAGVVDVAGLDRLVTETLGPRWALTGPFETAELNTPGGIRGHAARLGPAYRAIGEALGERDSGWSGELVEQVARQRRALLPEADIPAREAWRRRALARLLAARRDILDRERSRAGGPPATGADAAPDRPGGEPDG